MATLESAASERKAKLLALRAQRDGKRKAGDEPLEDAAPAYAAARLSCLRSTPGSSIVHRAYDQSTNAAKRHDRAEEEDTVEKAVEGLSQQIVAEDAERRQEDLVSTGPSFPQRVADGVGQDLLSIQPKKPNWDLKRDVDKKLAKLDHSYKSAVAQIIRRSTSFPARRC
jgi:coiled-coil domain-containing protein 12